MILNQSHEIDEGEYVVERIINHKFINGKCYYLLKWKDFDERDNTWEEESSLDCPDLLEEYQDLNIVRIEKDRITSQELEKEKIERKKEKIALLKSIIDENYTLSQEKKSELNVSEKFHNESELLKNASKYQELEQQGNSQKIRSIENNAISDMTNSLDFEKIISNYSFIPKVPKLQNSDWITIIGYKKDIKGQMLFSVVRKDGKIQEISKQEIIKKDDKLYLKFLEESYLSKYMNNGE